ncbi:TetR family transcriptional regulator [Nocardia zapadnayensis]|uniref:TetR/AcrR family transcriptional regulator n=1 Tax=Nocardia rhamnosiphila TaxID=426716 RepID=UPI002247AC6D|nr:TetR/AcrR family transcriptional regulator [Nocardia zapadnayensis]MCX0273003.1 TetR family transcriptional regulator [Nocardia zapadnayensis]
MTRARDAARAAAAKLFAERGYRQVTIRDIALAAGLSPAMVMKAVGSKEKLFHEVAEVAPLELDGIPHEELGRALVRNIIDRMRADAVEPLGRAIMLRLTAPDPETIQEKFTSGYFDALAERLGGGDDAELRSELAVGALLGLAAALRIFEAPHAAARSEQVVLHFGDIVQDLLDGVHRGSTSAQETVHDGNVSGPC